MSREPTKSRKPKITIAQAYERGYTFEFGNDSAGIKLHLDHRFELNNDLKAIVELTPPNISPEL